MKDYQLQKLRWKIGYVLQQIALFPTMSVKENIEIIPEMLGWDKIVAINVSMNYSLRLDLNQRRSKTDAG